MVTVIIPVYNAEKTIGRAIKSVISQPYVNQLILVNDASTDNSSSLISYFKDKYLCIKKFLKELEDILITKELGQILRKLRLVNYLRPSIIDLLVHLNQLHVWIVVPRPE